MGIEINSGSSGVGLAKDSEQKNTVSAVEISEKTTHSIKLERNGELKSSEAEYSIKNIQETVDELNASNNIRQRNLEFSVNEELGRTIVKVVDSETGKLIRQVPSEELVELAERIEAQTQQSENSVGYLIDSII